MSAPCPTYGFVMMMEATGDRASLEALYEELKVLLDRRGLYAIRRESPRLYVGSEASQATDADRQALCAWLASRSDLTRWTVGDLEDVG